jgi:hypothetical protein
MANHTFKQYTSGRLGTTQKGSSCTFQGIRMTWARVAYHVKCAGFNFHAWEVVSNILAPANQRPTDRATSRPNVPTNWICRAVPSTWCPGGLRAAKPSERSRCIHCHIRAVERRFLRPIRDASVPAGFVRVLPLAVPRTCNKRYIDTRHHVPSRVPALHNSILSNTAWKALSYYLEYRNLPLGISPLYEA